MLSIMFLSSVASASTPSSGRERISFEVADQSKVRMRVEFPRVSKSYTLQVSRGGSPFRTISSLKLRSTDLNPDGSYRRSYSGIFRTPYQRLTQGSNLIRVLINGVQFGLIKTVNVQAAESGTKGSPVDLQPPLFAISTVSISSNSLAIGSSFSLSVSLSDDRDCCKQVAIWLASQNRTKISEAAIIMTRKTATSVSLVANFTIPSGAVVGQYLLLGSAQDSAGNSTDQVSLGSVSVVSPPNVIDLANPVIDTSSGTVSPAQVQPGNNVTATYRITDDVGCCGYHQAWLYDPSGASVQQVTPTRLSGGPADAIYSAVFAVPAGSAQGVYTVKAQATDLTGKYTHLQAIGTITVLAQTSPPTVDTQLPVLVQGSGTMSPSNIQPGNPLTVSFRVTDDFGCCSSARGYLLDSTGNSVVFVESQRVSGTNLDGVYRSIINIPFGTAPGTYTIKAQAIDNAGKYTRLETLGTITVAAQTSPPTVDTQNPVIVPTSGSLSNPNPAAGATVTLSYRITDDMGCCNNHNAFMYDSTGTAIISAPAQRTGGTTLDGTYQAIFVLPGNLASGTYIFKSQVTDFAGNYSHLQLLASFTIP